MANANCASVLSKEDGADAPIHLDLLQTIIVL
jgi:hypothetical protein